ncbi:Zn(II)2Cys6 transcription factor [Aspergillus nomiae NRRL 13137]|uniref:Zn(II)2Cys6 transcription factor n=1 Tax=Aspergillus nomiae NRRL (strain ATCC 15546 / NRRL 13137 / CBS 260.88 / M93) TaxID=1509407 RepID=A0A0L1JFI7_ASPN3|nr:Zn(II)2Cys6 transcription factor [Aspergillus nomiae NRRL 13137]KNG90574.1 Zn(II)2Cys6 transcription factor [Aspergillus nomiae NRRL 13137]
MYPSPTSAERSEDETRQPRKRTARACDACYKRKIKCDAAVPQCNWCSHHNIPCTFERVIHKRRKDKTNANTQQKSTGLAERIDRIEKLLTDSLFREPTANASPTSSGPSGFEIKLPGPSHGQSSLPSSVPLHFAGRELSVVSQLTGIPFLLPEGQEWVQSRTGQKIDVDKLSPTRPPWEKQRALNSYAMFNDLQTGQIFDLPDRKVLELHLERYRLSLMQSIFPIVDYELFQETIDAVYQKPSPDSCYAESSLRGCIFAFLAFSSLIMNPCNEVTAPTPPPVDGEKYFMKAHLLVPQILQGTPTLDGVQAITAMALFELITGNLQSANYFGTLAARMLFMLGAHTSYPDEAEYPIKTTRGRRSRVQRQLRIIFWLGFTIEKDVCIRIGQPQMFTDENCDLTLPPGYVEQLYADMQVHHCVEELRTYEITRYPLFPVDLRLSIIKSRAYSALYSFKALKKTDAEILKDIRELDDELERWRMSIPLEWRPTLSFSHETPDPNVSMHSVMLRLNYHLCMTIIHQSSSRCKSWAKGQGGMMDGVSSSLALSVEASRSTLLYIEAAEHVLVDGIFWTLIFYPMSALLAIFCNILQNPSDPQATKDVRLLRTATGMMERLFSRQPFAVAEIVHIKLVADFVSELYRLATCAIEKAWNEGSH